MALARRTFLVGGAHTPFIGKGHPDFIWKGHPDFGKRDNPALEDLLTSAVRGVLDTTGVNPETVDRLYVGNFVGELFSSQGHLGAAMVGAHPAFDGKPAARLEGACASGGLALLAGIDAVAAGANTILVAGVELQTSQSARVGADYLARAAHYKRQRGIDDFTFPALFARRIKALHEARGLSDEDLGWVAVKAYTNANKNPNAHMRTKEMPFELAREASDRNPNFLGNEELKPYLKMSDCSQVSDGASAVLLVSEEGLRQLGLTEADVVEIVGTGHAVASLYQDSDPTRFGTSARAASAALAGAGISASDVGIAEVHDCFTVAELLMMEAAGFAPEGGAAAMVRAGETAIDGRLPINTGGGLIGFGHPVGATGVKQALEIQRQMKGLCGDYQVKRALEWGLTLNMGGDDKTAVSLAIHNLS